MRTCVYCSAPLPVQRWRADRPRGLGPATKSRPSPGRTPYLGPPSYGARPPRWGFPPVVWRDLVPAEADTSRDSPVTALRVGRWAAAITGVAALTAAAGEIWRYALMMRGRTEILSGPLVRASDLFLTIAGSAAVIGSLVTAIVMATVLVRLHGGGARRLGREPSRPPASVLARLVVPGWNVWGLGIIAAEVDGYLAADPERAGHRPRMSVLVLSWWIAWILDNALVLTTLLRAFGTSDQAVADTVELHIFVDLVGAAVAVLTALVGRRFLRLLVGPSPRGAGRWVVAPPAPTRQPAMVNTAPASEAVGPEASQTTASASASGDQPADDADPEPTTVSPTP
ncbi:protein of unknown function [Nakamurella panacisegetis]|uniref:DUF4328 domain-containing protein n=1 Tax=Nakamurella panacisegetis TaxID=1090615 RepID=A0A1H0K8Z7_9ACTN|nr:protein of unknown function [Nakamurella panacisegetis]